jgi:phospholipid/cholesterol/gamma-HCH transport system ATP-binding protein
MGQVVLLLPKYGAGRARIRRADVWEMLADCGHRALPIVAIVNLLMGGILAFVGAVELEDFGAGIYVANLVGIASVRELTPILIAIVLAGRTGASFAATLATMQGNEEIDALTTLGVPAEEFLVLPRVVTLSLLMPLFFVYGSAFALLGGLLVATPILGLSPVRVPHADAGRDRRRELRDRRPQGALVRRRGRVDRLPPGPARLAQRRRRRRGHDQRGRQLDHRGHRPRRRVRRLRARAAHLTMDAGAAISIDDVDIGYGGAPVQSGIRVEIERGEIFAIVGDSGSGKSTLLKTMIGLIPPCRGSIRFAGKPLAEHMERGAPPFGVLFQNGALWTSMTVEENVTLPMELQRYSTPAARPALARFKLALVGLAGHEHQSPASLSGGMRKRAALARALALDPGVLFLDEPSAGLDPLTSRRLDRLVIGLRDGLGITVVLVTHELESLYSIADRMLFLDGEAHRRSRSAPRPSSRATPRARRSAISCARALRRAPSIWRPHDQAASRRRRCLPARGARAAGGRHPVLHGGHPDRQASANRELLPRDGRRAAGRLDGHLPGRPGRPGDVARRPRHAGRAPADHPGRDGAGAEPRRGLRLAEPA